MIERFHIAENYNEGHHTTNLSSRPGIMLFLFQSRECGPAVEECR